MSRGSSLPWKRSAWVVAAAAWILWLGGVWVPLTPTQAWVYHRVKQRNEMRRPPWKGYYSTSVPQGAVPTWDLVRRTVRTVPCRTLTRRSLSPVTTVGSRNPIDLDAWRSEVTVEELMDLVDTAKRAARAAGRVMLQASNRTLPDPPTEGPLEPEPLEPEPLDRGTATSTEPSVASTDEALETKQWDATSLNSDDPTASDPNEVTPVSDARATRDARAAPPNENSAVQVSSTKTTLPTVLAIEPHDAMEMRPLETKSTEVTASHESHPVVSSEIETNAWTDREAVAEMAETTIDAKDELTVPLSNALLDVPVLATPIPVTVAPPPLPVAPTETLGTSVSTGATSHVAAFLKSSIKDICTVYDNQAQDVISTMVHHRYPDHSFLGEESVGDGPAASEAALQRALLQASNSHYLWICDPIDGTANFASGLALSAVTIAVVYKGTVIVGVVYDPYRNDMYAACKGQGAYLNDIYPLSVAQRVTTVRDAVINAGCPVNVNAFACSMRGIQALNGQSLGVRMIACSALTTAWIAAGRLTAHFGYDLHSWDLAAGALLIQEAGGLVTDLSGMPYQLSTRNMLCSNGLVHYEILDILQDASAVSFTRSK